jgi:formate hydrogenlyase subunit 3/multisubunit Na+/H+ antiporter MnhD subunit
MRALCGAIITAGALIGMGLTAIAFGNRYGQTVGLERNNAGEIMQLHLYEMDRPLVFILIFLTAIALVGLAVSFIGLAYHHHRRHHEMLHFERLHPATPAVP